VAAKMKIKNSRLLAFVRVKEKREKGKRALR
jgi:hypothetical protein